LEALADERRSLDFRHLHRLGPIADAGYLARNERVLARWSGGWAARRSSPTTC